MKEEQPAKKDKWELLREYIKARERSNMAQFTKLANAKGRFYEDGDILDKMDELEMKKQDKEVGAFDFIKVQSIVSENNSLRTKVQELEKELKKQECLCGKLMRENEYLNDSVSRRQEWLRDAKKDAGFKDQVSFDDVWKDTLTQLTDLKRQLEDYQKSAADVRNDWIEATKEISRLSKQLSDLKRERDELKFKSWVYDNYPQQFSEIELLERYNA